MCKGQLSRHIPFTDTVILSLFSSLITNPNPNLITLNIKTSTLFPNNYLYYFKKCLFAGVEGH